MLNRSVVSDSLCLGSFNLQFFQFEFFQPLMCALGRCHWFMFIPVVGQMCELQKSLLMFLVLGCTLCCSAWASLVETHGLCRLSCSKACGLLVPRAVTEPESLAVGGGFLTRDHQGSPIANVLNILFRFQRDFLHLISSDLI